MSGKSNSSTGNMKKHLRRKHPGVTLVDNPETEEAFVHLTYKKIVF